MRPRARGHGLECHVRGGGEFGAAAGGGFEGEKSVSDEDSGRRLPKSQTYMPACGIEEAPSSWKEFFPVL